MLPSQVASSDADAQRNIDEEIAAHEAAILKLKTRRNTYSLISKLPIELIAKVFLLWKWLANDIPNNPNNPWARNWLNVSGVCRQWREVVLNAPRLWSSIQLDPHCDRITEMLRRSKSAPLQISCSHLHSYDHKLLRPIAETVMSDMTRIQELDLAMDNLNALVGFLRLSTDASAPQLELLQLTSRTRSIIPVDVFWRDMPILRVMSLQNIQLSSPLPPLPRLSQLSITFPLSNQRLPLSWLLASLRNVANLEVLFVSEVVSDLSPQISTPLCISLPKLFAATIMGDDFQSSKIFDHISHPNSTSITFSCSAPSLGLDLSSLRGVCSRLAARVAPSIRRVLISHAFCFDLRAWVLDAAPRNPPHLSLALPLPSPEVVTDYVRLCSILPLATVPVLAMRGVASMPPEFLRLLNRFERLTTLFIEDGDSAVLAYLLGCGDGKGLPLPELQTLHLQTFSFDSESQYNTAFDLMISLLSERALLGKPIRKLVMRTCRITDAWVAELSKHVEVDWDGRLKRDSEPA